MGNPSIYGTRTSRHWETRPGRMDALNLRDMFPSSSRYGIPDIAPSATVPTSLAAWHVARQRAHAATTGGAIHFYLDDYRFESMWSSPIRGLARVREVGRVITPDFSLWRDMPRAAGIWNVYRSRWCGAFWQSHGVDVIPHAMWGGPDTFDFCFDGMPRGGSVSISTMSIGADHVSQSIYRAGLEQLLDRTQPTTLLSYGKMRHCDGIALPAVIEFPTFWDRRRKAMSSD